MCQEGNGRVGLVLKLVMKQTFSTKLKASRMILILKGEQRNIRIEACLPPRCNVHEEQLNAILDAQYEFNATPLSRSWKTLWDK